MSDRELLDIENAKIIWPNFEGRAEKFNRQGDRYFNVILDDEKVADDLSKQGYNVKVRAPRDEGDKPFYYLPVKVRFDNYPPNIWLVTGKKKTRVTEDIVGELDHADIRYVDVTISPYAWEVNDKSGVTAYLKTMYVVQEEDSFASKYAEEEVPF